MTLWPTVQFLPIVSGKAGIGVAGGIVLHVGAFADLDPLIVAAQHRAEPHAGRILEAHLADHDRGIRDEIVSVRGKIGPLPVEFVDRHRKKVSVRGDLGIAAGAGSSEAGSRLRPARLRHAASSAKNVPDIRLQKPDKHGRHHHEFEAAALDPGAAQRVAHDDEGCGENQKRHRRKRLRRDAFPEQPEPRRPLPPSPDSRWRARRRTQSR